MGRGSTAHNNRTFSTPNVDQSRTSENITLVQEDVREVYHQLFDVALEKYNATRKKSRDKIPDYYEKIRSGKQEKLFHEAVFQLGNKDNCACGSSEALRAAEILKEYTNTFQSRNPHLRVFNAVIHMDEATPHVHIDFVPFATEQKRGLETRVSLKRALLQQGFEGTSKKQSEWTAWMNSEKAVLEQMAAEHDFVVEHGDGGRKHLSLPEFKAVAHELDEAKAELDTIRQQLHEQQKLRERQEQEQKQLAEENKRLKEERAALIEANEQIKATGLEYIEALEDVKLPHISSEIVGMRSDQVKSGFGGAVKGVTVSQVKSLIETVAGLLAAIKQVMHAQNALREKLAPKKSLLSRLSEAKNTQKQQNNDIPTHTQKRDTPSL